MGYILIHNNYTLYIVYAPLGKYQCMVITGNLLFIADIVLR